MIYGILLRAAADALRNIAADTRHLGAERSVPLPCCTHGARRCTTIRMCTASCRAAVCHLIEHDGCRAGRASFCPCGFCPDGSGECASRSSMPRSRLANGVSPAHTICIGRTGANSPSETRLYPIPPETLSSIARTIALAQMIRQTECERNDRKRWIGIATGPEYRSTA